MINLVIIGSILVGGVDDQEIDSRQFLQIVKTLQSVFQDVTFIFEGERRVIGKNLPATFDVPSYELTFQGQYSYRNDESISFELYKHFSNNQPYSRSIMTLLGSSLEETVFYPDLGGLQTVRRRRGSPEGFLRYPMSPENYLYINYLNNLSKKSRIGFEHAGWQDIDSHRCLRVKIDRLSSDDQNRPRETLWIDLSRGGHPLRMETYVGGSKTLSCSNIELKEFILKNGSKIWFPIKGRTEMFSLDGESLREPFAFEESYVVDGSLQFNRSPPDSEFSAEKKLSRTSSPRFVKPPASLPSFSTSHEAIQKNLENRLAEAKSQSVELNASDPSFVDMDWADVFRICLTVLGVVFFVTAIFWKWKATK